MNLNLNSGRCVYFPSGSRRTSYLSSFLHWHILKKAFNSPRTCSGDSQHGVIFLLFVQILEKQLLGTAFCNQFLSHHIKWSFSKKALKASSQDHLINLCTVQPCNPCGIWIWILEKNNFRDCFFAETFSTSICHLIWKTVIVSYWFSSSVLGKPSQSKSAVLTLFKRPLVLNIFIADLSETQNSTK